MSKFDTSITAGSLMWHETRLIAPYFLEGQTDQEIKEGIIKENLFQKRTAKTIQNLVPIVVKRLKQAPDNVVDLIANGNSEVSKQATFMAIILQNRILRDFLGAVISEKIRSYSPSISLSDWDDFWIYCQNHDHSLATKSNKTVSEVRRVIFKILKEAGILEPKSNKIHSFRFVPEIRSVLNKLDDGCFKRNLEVFL